MLTNSDMYNGELEVGIWGLDNRCNNEPYQRPRYWTQNDIGRNIPPELSMLLFSCRLHAYTIYLKLQKELL